jgi:predicted HTH transcriptional regulator
MTTKQRIAEYVQQNPKSTVQQIAEGTELTAMVAGANMSLLVKEKTAKKNGDGTYEIVAAVKTYTAPELQFKDSDAAEKPAKVKTES